MHFKDIGTRKRFDKSSVKWTTNKDKY